MFEAAYKEGHTVQVIRTDGISHVRIKGVRALPSHEHDWGSLTAGSVTSRQECTHLELDAGQFAQYWVKVRDNFELELLHPRSTNFFNNKRASNVVGANWRIRPYLGEQNETPEVQNMRLAASEFWVWEDDTPLFDLYPPLSVQNPQGHVEFFGYRYSYDELPVGAEGAVTRRFDKFD